MAGHRHHAVLCCNDCGNHPAGTCDGCDRRRRLQARRPGEPGRGARERRRLDALDRWARRVYDAP